jgi:hypothetical protein
MTVEHMPAIGEYAFIADCHTPYCSPATARLTGGGGVPHDCVSSPDRLHTPPCARRLAGFQSLEVDPRLQRVWRSRHRLHPETTAAPVGVGERIAREQLDIPVAAVHPDRCTATVRPAKAHPGAAAPVALQVAEGDIELDIVDTALAPGVVVGAVNALAPAGDPAVIGREERRAGASSVQASTSPVGAARYGC